jgi:hypothetical protein
LNSIRSLIKRNKNATNPYNRSEIPKEIIRNARRLSALNNIYYPKNNSTENGIVSNAKSQSLTILEQIRHNKPFNARVSNLFYEIDQVNNYTSPEWMINLGRNKLANFIHYIYHLWTSRGGIMSEVKQKICPHFNPFMYKNILVNFSPEMSLSELQNIAVTVCENLFHTAIDVEYKKLSAMYILMSMTVVSNDARQSLPWLYDATL